MVSDVSVLKPLGYQRSKRCGYCKTSIGSSSYYIACDGMRIDHYQELVDRGWRRSGTTYYKPDLVRSCCPHYTIRLKADQFKSKRDQRRSLNRWNEYVLGSQYKQQAAMLCPQSKQKKRELRDKFDLFNAVHMAEYQNVERPTNKKTSKPIEPAHKYEVTLEAATFSKEKYTIFLKYQKAVHQDPESRWGEESFKRFLCDGLKQEQVKVGNYVKKLGSYHQCYRVDGRLVAVGVLDLLPHAVSSVYLFNDPEFHDWEFGKMSAMREIALATEGQYDWYYMGYYIHSCPKVRYKGNYEPSYLLDPETLTWNELGNELRNKLDEQRYFCPSNPSHVGELDKAIPKQEQDTRPPSQTSPPDGASHSPHDKVYVDDHEMDSDPSDAEDTDIPEGSLFEYKIPGVLKKAEVARLNLDHWKLLIRNSMVDFEDIRGWEQQRIDDPTSLKGIVAELAATLGPKLLQNSAVQIF